MIIHWDCLEKMKKLEDNSIDMILTSPPYDNLRTYNWSLLWNFEIFMWIANQCKRVIKEWGVIVWVVWDATIKWSETWTSFKQALYFKEIWLNLHDTMIWNKWNFTATWSLKYRYASVFEYMFILTKWKIETFNPLKDRLNKSYWRTKTWTVRQVDWSVKNISNIWKSINKYWQRHNVWNITPEKNNNKRLHPAIFSEELARDHIISWSNQWDTILDPFAWSWTTWIAAKQLWRNYIIIEKEKEYIDIIKKRLNEKIR